MTVSTRIRRLGIAAATAGLLAATLATGTANAGTRDFRIDESRQLVSEKTTTNQRARIKPSDLASARVADKRALESSADSSDHRSAECRGLAADRVVTPNETAVLDVADEVVVVYGEATVEGSQTGSHQICVHDDPDDFHFTEVTLHGDGNDMILTASGQNIVDAGGGDDRIYLNAHDLGIGGAGNDEIWIANGGAAQAEGGNDVVFGGPGPDHIELGDGDDIAFGFGANDHLYGGEGQDELVGGLGWDTLDGEGNLDTCKDYAGTEGAEMFSCTTVIAPGAASTAMFTN